MSSSSSSPLIRVRLRRVQGENKATQAYEWLSTTGFEPRPTTSPSSSSSTMTREPRMIRTARRIVPTTYTYIPDDEEEELRPPRLSSHRKPTSSKTNQGGGGGGGGEENPSEEKQDDDDDDVYEEEDEKHDDDDYDDEEEEETESKEEKKTKKKSVAKKKKKAKVSLEKKKKKTVSKKKSGGAKNTKRKGGAKVPPVMKAPLGPYGTISITWGDQAENHKGMQMLGTPAAHGLTCTELRQASVLAQQAGCVVELHDLRMMLRGIQLPSRIAPPEPACFLLVKQGVAGLLGQEQAANLKTEVQDQPVDTRALMYNKVVQKHLRWNNTYADISQKPDIANKKGTVVSLATVPQMRAFREALPRWFGDKATGLVAETNYYRDSRIDGIGYHGDSERKMVICARFGSPMPLAFQWFFGKYPIGPMFISQVNGGDMYVFSEKATGHDWKAKRTILTLRHAAGVSFISDVEAKKEELKDEIAQMMNTTHKSSSSSSSSSKPHQQPEDE